MSPGISEKKTSQTTVSTDSAPGDLQSNLRRLDQLANLGIVSAGVAHEIKNGLVAINTFIELLLQKAEDKEMAAVVQRELQRIDMLATQMLRLAAPKPPSLASVRVHEVLERSLRLLEHQTQSHGIKVNRKYGAQPDMVRGDEAQLQQAFMNLLLNAVEAMGNSGELTVATESADGKIKISFQDSGGGITLENLSRLFEPFFTTKKNGTGLGLAICQRIAEEHLGGINVKSEPGRGSTFIISLPAE